MVETLTLYPNPATLAPGLLCTAFVDAQTLVTSNGRVETRCQVVSVGLFGCNPSHHKPRCDEFPKLDKDQVRLAARPCQVVIFQPCSRGGRIQPG